MPNSKQIVYLSQAQYAELIANGTITVDGVTVTYNENDIYVTPQAEPVTDVRVNGTSIAANGVANIPLASNQTPGVIMVSSSYGHQIANGILTHKKAASSTIKQGNDVFDPIVSSNQHESIFYGLSKAAGVDLKNETVTLGIYPDTSKAAIQQMLGISNLLAPTETTTASKAYSIGEVFTSNGKLYKATAAIAAADAIVVQDEGEEVSGHNAEEVKVADYAVHDVQVNGTSVVNGGVANVPKATNSSLGVIQCSPNYGTNAYSTGIIGLSGANISSVKAGENYARPIVCSNQHTSVFYGLAKVAGADMASLTGETVGIYPDAQKAAIQHMLGTDTNLASYESDTTADQAYAIGELFMLNSKLHQATAAIAIGDTLEVGTNCAVVNAAGVFPHDVQVNGTSVVANGIANISIPANVDLVAAVLAALPTWQGGSY